MTTDVRTSDAADTGIGDAGGGGGDGDGDGAMTSTDAAAALGRSEERRALAVRVAVARRAVRDVPSPCISVCRIDAASALCTGCLRTLDEIAAWSRMEDAGKRLVWRAIERRMRPLPSPS